MAGLNDRRRLGTESGRIRRAARQVERDGGNPSALLNLAAQTKLGEGSAIMRPGESEAIYEHKNRLQSGLMESKRRATLGGDSRQAFADDLDRSALVKTDSAARQRAYDRGATLGVSREDIDKRAGTAPLQRTTMEARSTDPQIPGLTSTKSVPSATGSVTGKTGTAPSLLRAPMESVAAADSRSLSRRKEMRAAEDAITGGGEPGNLAGLQSRDAKDRADAITAARAASADPTTSTTRRDVIDKLNKERVASGRQPFGDDIYREMGKSDSADRDKVRSKAQFEATGFGGEFASARTPLQKSLIEARTRFAPPPAEVQGPPVSAEPTELQGPPVSAKSVAPPSFGSDPRNTGMVTLGGTFDATKKRFKDEEAKGYNTPLRSATLAAKSGLSRFVRDTALSFR